LIRRSGKQFLHPLFLNIFSIVMPSYTLNINGEKKAVSTSADTPLLWVLRDELGMVGTKFGCGKSLCGACTVHVNGTPVRSCSMPVSGLAGANITTIEGISADASHAVQQAWILEDVPQCGYCQAGQIMSAVALLAQNPKPTDADIDAAMSGNLCRCATYTRIRKAIHRAAEIQASNGNAKSDAKKGVK
jgi:isoquinoline 1-oxidoreductase alpha subunit